MYRSIGHHFICTRLSHISSEKNEMSADHTKNKQTNKQTNKNKQKRRKTERKKKKKEKKRGKIPPHPPKQQQQQQTNNNTNIVHTYMIMTKIKQFYEHTKKYLYHIIYKHACKSNKEKTSEIKPHICKKNSKFYTTKTKTATTRTKPPKQPITQN